MYKYICTVKTRLGELMWEILQDKNGHIIRIKTNEFVKEIKNGLQVSNIRITEANKIMQLTDDLVENNKGVNADEIERLANYLITQSPKLKLMGHTVINIGESLFVSKDEINHYLYIPDNVTKSDGINEQLRNKVGKLTVIGGKGLTNIDDLFRYCDFYVINIENMYTENIESANSTFANSKVTLIQGIEYFNTSNLESAKYMFQDCVLGTLNLSRWRNNPKLKNIEHIFFKVRANKIIMAWFDCSHINNMEGAFYNSKIGILDLSHIKATNCDNTDNLFTEVMIGNLVLTKCEIGNLGYIDSKLFLRNVNCRIRQMIFKETKESVRHFYTIPDDVKIIHRD